MNITNKMIEKIDDELSRKGIPINQRKLHAINKYNENFSNNHKINPLLKNPDKDLIYNWYDTYYGNRNYTKNFPSYAIFLRNNPYEFTPPIIFGKMNFFIKDTLLKNTKDLTHNMLDLLTDNDLNIIKYYIKDILKINNFLIQNEMYIILSDLISAKNYLVYIYNFKMVEWQCLQATEKFIKDYLIKKNISNNPPKTHNLKILIDLTGIQEPFLLNKINDIETSPSVRYEEDGSILDAINKYKNTISFITRFIDYY